MLDGDWRIYSSSGEFLGEGETNIAGDVLYVSSEVAKRISHFDKLHLDDFRTNRAFIFKVVNIRPDVEGNKMRVSLAYLDNRPSKYALPQIKSQTIWEKILKFLRR